MSHKAQFVARKFVNMVDRVPTDNRTLVPAFWGITRVDRGNVMESFTRETRVHAAPPPIFTSLIYGPESKAWEAFNDLTLRDVIGLSRKGDCE